MQSTLAKIDAINSFDLMYEHKTDLRKNIYGECCNLNKIYRVTNESASFFMPDFINNNDKVLSVAASGDQYLNCILYGANSVDLFDINAISYYFSILKIVSAKVLPVEEFKEFLVNKMEDGANETYMNIKYYNKVKMFLPKRVREYFDLLYYYIFKIDSEFNLWFLLAFDDPDFDLKDSCPYLDDYKYLQNKLQNINLPKFYLGELANVLKRLNQKYDKMIFSNICDYVEYFMDDFAYTEAFPHLNDNGIIQLAYIWYVSRNCVSMDDSNMFDSEKYNIYFKSIGIYNDFFKRDIKNEVVFMKK